MGRYSRFSFVLFAGFLLPAITIGFELVTCMCAEALFDPLPSLAHLAVVTAVSRGWLFAGAAGIGGRL